MSYTPGPWKIVESNRHARDGRPRRIVCKDHYPDGRIAIISLRGMPGGDTEIHQANATLIAAAPKMHSACYAAQRMLRRLSACNNDFLDEINAVLTELAIAIDAAESVKEQSA